LWGGHPCPPTGTGDLLSIYITSLNADDVAVGGMEAKKLTPLEFGYQGAFTHLEFTRIKKASDYFKAGLFT
jgi:hypothetical protein